MSSSRQPTIVVIDSSQRVLAITRATLENAGFRVITHARSTGCVALILQERPDLVLLDINMPFVAGDTIAKLFGKAQPNSDTIVLLHSSLSVEAMEAKVRTCGAHGFIQKSEDAYELVRQVNSWLKRGHSSGKMRVAARIEEEDPLARPSGARRAAPTISAAPEATSDSLREPPRVSGTLPIFEPTVLFIDDDMGTLSAFRREVQREGYTVEFALSGTQALRRIISGNPPSLVVSDLLMPEPNGAEVYRRAVENDASWSDRFVFVTGASMMPGMSDFLARFRGRVLQKPVQGERLRAAIRDALHAHHLEEAARAGGG